MLPEDDGLDILLSQVDERKLLPKKDNRVNDLLPEDDGLDDLLSQVEPEELLSQVQNIEVPRSVSKVSKRQEKATRILEVMNLQNCNVTFNFKSD